VVIEIRGKEVVYHDPVMGASVKAKKAQFLSAWRKFGFRGVRIWKRTKK
jgi:predicted double-glycine peptidase